MTTEAILIFLGALVLFSYIFDLFAARARVPSVVLLLALGFGIRAAADRIGDLPFDPTPLLPTLGTIGLIMIVLDGALELEYSRQKRGLILRALFTAIVGLLLTGAAFTFLLHHFTGFPWRTCMANAIPFSVISSAVAIPSALGLAKVDREFIIYESSLSDILGVIAFNAVAAVHEPGVAISIGGAALDLVAVIGIGLVSCLLLFFVMARSKHHVRSFLILALLLMIYGIAKSFHLSSLVIVLIFGLFIANVELLPWQWLKRLADYPNAEEDRKTLQTLTMESTFIVRTFFFVLFGFTIPLNSLIDPDIWSTAFFGMAAIYVIRAGVLGTMFGKVDRAVLVLAPRGLITVLLYLSLPERYMIPQIDHRLVVAVVLGMAVVMAIILTSKRKVVE